MRDTLRFFGSFVRKPARIGAVVPSSQRLARLLCGDLALKPGDVVVEYGPGTGPMTRLLDERLPRGVDYLGIELDARFHALLQKRFPKRLFANDSAHTVCELLEEHRLGPPKLIVSGIPFASLPEDVQRAIVGGTKQALAQDGEFRTFQYVHAYAMAAAKRFRAAMEEAFSSFERLGPVVWNLPPAYVLVYRH